jgi:hypothetical protein
METLKLAILTTVAALAVGCQGETLFFDNFDAEPLGLRPSLDPPGAPAGDEIYLSNPDTEDPDTVTVVADSDFAGHSLRYLNVDTPLYYRYVGFYPKTADPDATQFQARWTGKLNATASTSALDIWFGDSHFLDAALIRLENGHAYLKTSTGSSPTFEDLGVLEVGEVHTVFINLYRDTATYSITLLQPGDDLESGERPVLNASTLTTARPTLYMLFSEEVSSSGSYTMDDVTIAQIFPSSSAVRGPAR